MVWQKCVTMTTSLGVVVMFWQNREDLLFFCRYTFDVNQSQQLNYFNSFYLICHTDTIFFENFSLVRIIISEIQPLKGQTDGQTDRWTDAQTDGLTDGSRVIMVPFDTQKLFVLFIVHCRLSPDCFNECIQMWGLVQKPQEWLKLTEHQALQASGNYKSIIIFFNISHQIDIIMNKHLFDYTPTAKHLVMHCYHTWASHPPWGSNNKVG